MADADHPQGDNTAASSSAEETPYRVLARKYRPQTFDDLIGQEAMVRTLSNAFERGRIAQAYLLSGVRGIGKTTTARIIARALNCVGLDGAGGPTIQPCGQCRHCLDIIADRHVDVIEMDAASNNSVDNIREITEAARYRPASARYKVYILDEAHMLSTQAFNALLKTLEEPPPHVKFIFATTEARRLPVTVLSRCQRFDLRRVSPDRLTALFARIAQKEGAVVEEEALAMIARAADGSVRDGLSLLDQGIALAEADGAVTAVQVRSMLGLADRLSAYDLFEAAMGGDAKRTLHLFDEMIAVGADPAAAMQDLMEAAYWTTRMGVDPEGSDFAASSAAERERAGDLAKRLNFPALSRAWQLLSKGHAETLAAPSPRLAAEMALIRLAYAATMPTPDDLLRRIDAENSRNVGAVAGQSSALPNAASSTAPNASQNTAPDAASNAVANAPSGHGVSAPIGHGASASAAAAAPDKSQIQAPTQLSARLVTQAGQAVASAPMLDEEVPPSIDQQVHAQSAPEPAPLAPVISEASSPVDFPDFDSLLTHLGNVGAARALSLTRRLRLVEYAQGRIVYAGHDELPENYAKRLREELGKATNRVWTVEESEAPGQLSRVDEEAAAEAALRAHPMVVAALAAFPDGELTLGRPRLDEPELPPPPEPVSDGEDLGYDNPDVVYDDDLNFGDWELDD